MDWIRKFVILFMVTLIIGHEKLCQIFNLIFKTSKEKEVKGKDLEKWPRDSDGLKEYFKTQNMPLTDEVLNHVVAILKNMIKFHILLKAR